MCVVIKIYRLKIINKFSAVIVIDVKLYVVRKRMVFWVIKLEKKNIYFLLFFKLKLILDGL